MGSGYSGWESLESRTLLAAGGASAEMLPAAAVESGLFADGRANAMAYDNAYAYARAQHLVYFDAADASLKYARRSGNTWSAPTVIDATPGAGQMLSLLADASGHPAVAYYDSLNGDLRFAQYDGAAWQVQTVDAWRTTGLYPCLRWDAAGKPVITYYNKSYGDLKMAAWNGSAWAVSTIDAQGDAGRYSSLARNPDTGRWAVAYENDADGSFRYAEQTKSGWSLAVVDRTRGGGGYVSLAFSGMHQVGISYYDAWNADLKFAMRNGGVWSTCTVAARGSQGMYGHLVFWSDKDASIIYYNRTADAVFRAHGGQDMMHQPWTFEQLASGGGRELSTSSAGSFRSLGFVDTASSDLRVVDW